MKSKQILKSIFTNMVIKSKLNFSVHKMSNNSDRKVSTISFHFLLVLVYSTVSKATFFNRPREACNYCKTISVIKVKFAYFPYLSLPTFGGLTNLGTLKSLNCCCQRSVITVLIYFTLLLFPIIRFDKFDLLKSFTCRCQRSLILLLNSVSSKIVSNVQITDKFKFWTFILAVANVLNASATKYIFHLSCCC